MPRPLLRLSTVLLTSLAPALLAPLSLYAVEAASPQAASHADAPPASSPATNATPNANKPVTKAPAAAAPAQPANSGAGDAKRAAPAAAPAAAAPAAKETGAAAGEAHSEPVLKRILWSFDGMTGGFDKQAAQRGFQVYKQVCSACHSMNQVSYRSLGALGFSEAEIKALAAEKQVDDFNEKGERIQRPGKPFDHIVPPYPNEDASRAANNGAYPPDMSLLIKARHDGPDYIYSIVTGYSAAPASETPIPNKYYNPYFPGHWISMPPPLSENVVTYQDGTQASVDQMARDVVTFLEWAAEPELEARKSMGIKALLFLSAFALFCYQAKKRVWRNIKK